MKKKCTAYVRVDGFRSHHHQHVIFWAVRLFKVRFTPTQFACSSNCTTRMVWIKNNKCIFSPYFFAIKNVFYFLLIVVASFLLFLFFSLSFRWVSSLRIITTTTTTKKKITKADQDSAHLTKKWGDQALRHSHTHTKRYHFHWITSGKNGRFPRALSNEEGKILFFPVCCVLAAFQAITFENPLCLFFWITFHHFLLVECFRCVFYFSSIYLLWCRSLYAFWIFRSWFFKCYYSCAWFIHSVIRLLCWWCWCCICHQHFDFAFSFDILSVSSSSSSVVVVLTK